MQKEFITKQKEKLLEQKEKLEKQLSSFARQSKEAKGGWEAKMPSFNSGNLEEEADEVEEYSTLLALENTLEQELKAVNKAFERIKKGGYGTCAKCGKPISQGRLIVYPQAEKCIKCK